MAKYMLLLGGVDYQKPARPDLSREQVMQAYADWTKRLAAEGRMHGGHKLFDRDGRNLRWQDGRVVDGPFSESKEAVGGYYVIEAKDLDEACRIAADVPTVVLQGGFCQVRPVEV